MNRTAIAIFSMLLICLPLAICQTTTPLSNNDTGVHSNGLYSADHELVNPQTGNMSLQIALVRLPGRAGNDLSYTLSYNSNFWYLRTSQTPTGQTRYDISWENLNPQKNWGPGWSSDTPYFTYSIQFAIPGFPNPGTAGSVQCDTNYTMVLPTGAKVAFDWNTIRTNCNRWVTNYSTTRDTSYDINSASEGIDGVMFDAPSQTATLPNGTKISYSNYVITDRNGNQITNGGTVDTLGRSIVVTNLNPGYAIDYPDENPANNVATVSVSYGTFTISPITLADFGCHPTGLTFGPPSGSQGTAITSINFPDGSSYRFWYNNFYEMSAIQYPTGGYTRYVYGNVCGSLMPPPSRRILQKFTCRDQLASLQAEPTAASCPSGEDETDFNYPLSADGTVLGSSGSITEKSGVITKKISSISWSVDQNNNYSCLLTFQDAETGKTKTILNSRFGTDACAAPTSSVTTLDDGSTHYTTTYTYNDLNAGFGIPDDLKIFDFDGTLLRETKTTFWANSIHVFGIPTDVKIYDQKGLLAETSYGIDEPNFPLQGITGATHHDDQNYGTGTVVRGNVTSISRILLPPYGNSRPLTTNRRYDTLGNLIWERDPGLHETTFDYSDNFPNPACPPSQGTYAYPTNTALPLGHHIARSYFSCSGLLQSSKDDNDINNGRPGTTHLYDVMHRPTLISTVPNGGQSTTLYDPNTVTTTVTATPNPSIVSVTNLDGLGRVLHQSIGPNTVDNLYDGLGRLVSKSNPHIGIPSSTDGVTLYETDGFDRVKKITSPSGGWTTTEYIGNTRIVTDQTSRQMKYYDDALGRLYKVDEPSITGGLSNPYTTQYFYDGLSNLKCIEQHGTITDNSNARCSNLDDSNDRTSAWRIRRFAYDSLSRLHSSNNPESGKLSYTYDDDGIITSRTGGRLITTTYSADALHRITNISYTNGDPAVTYRYDETTDNGLTITNGVGRRTGMTDGSGSTAWSYDLMGRIVAVRQSVGTYSKLSTYSYDRAGAILTIGYPSGRTLTYVNDDTGRPRSAIDQSNSISYATEAQYSPSGQLTSLRLGSNILLTSTYNDRLQPVSIVATASGSPILDRTYDYTSCSVGKNNGNVCGITDGIDNQNIASRPIGSTNFQYDNLNRLSSFSTLGTDCTLVKQPYTTKNSGSIFDIDAWGNLKGKTVTKCTAEPLAKVIDITNHFSDGYYDGDGNMTQNGQYVYDAENRLIKLSGDPNPRFIYNGDGQRVAKDSRQYWLGADGSILAESTSDGSLTSEYIFFGGKRIARLDLQSP